MSDISETHVFLVQGTWYNSGTLRATLVHEGTQIHKRPGASSHLQPKHHPADLCEGIVNPVVFSGQSRNLSFNFFIRDIQHKNMYTLFLVSCPLSDFFFQFSKEKSNSRLLWHLMHFYGGFYFYIADMAEKKLVLILMPFELGFKEKATGNFSVLVSLRIPETTWCLTSHQGASMLVIAHYPLSWVRLKVRSIRLVF